MNKEILKDYTPVAVSDKNPIQEGDILEYTGDHITLSKGSLYPVKRHFDAPNSLYIDTELVDNSTKFIVPEGAVIFNVDPIAPMNYNVWRKAELVKPNERERQAISSYVNYGNTKLERVEVHLPAVDFIDNNAKGIVECIHKKYPELERFDIVLNDNVTFKSQITGPAGGKKHSVQFHVDLHSAQVLETFKVSHLR